MNHHPDVVEPDVGNKDEHGIFGTFLDLPQFDIFLLRCFGGSSKEVHITEERPATKGIYEELQYDLVTFTRYRHMTS